MKRKIIAGVSLTAALILAGFIFFKFYFVFGEGVKAGEECEIIFSGKYGFGNDSFGIIPANSALLYKIWVISISNE